MTPENFCYWLQGYFELKQTIDHRDGATPETMKVIEDHLKTVFVKVTPEVKVQINPSGSGEQLAEEIKKIIRRDIGRNPLLGTPFHTGGAIC